MASHTEFDTLSVSTGAAHIFARRCGSGPPVLLLHGFPQTQSMWHRVAPLLAAECTVVCADLRGYGRSSCPGSSADHAPYSKRALASDMVALMEQIGFTRFALVGHDRGARVAYRLALDHPDRVERVAVLDVLPVADAWRRADARFALAFWPWSLLAQPEPLPECVLQSCADSIIDHALSQWGSPADAFPVELRTEYADALRDAAHAHAICEEYRAASTIDREHDEGDCAAGRRIQCPLLVLWSRRGGLESWYARDGGPLAIWRRWADRVEGHAIDGGHFFPEERPLETADALRAFLRSDQAAGR